MRTLLVTILCLLAFAAQAGLLEELKLRRTYYFISVLSPRAHQFEVWVHDGGHDGWVEYYASAHMEGPVGEIGEDAFRSPDTGVIGLSTPPSNLSVPQNLQEAETAFREKIKTSFPGVTDVRIGYRGNFARYKVIEFTPLDPPHSPERWGMESEATFEVKDGKVEQSMDGGRFIDRRLLRHSVDESDALLDFSLPSSIEGSSLLHFGFLPRRKDQVSPHYEAYRALLATLKDFESSDRQKISQTEIRTRILSQQGDEFFPPEFQQFLEIRFDILAEGHDQSKTDDQVEFRIPVIAALTNQIEASAMSPVLGFKVDLRGGVGENSSLNMSITARDGSSVSMTGTSEIAGLLKSPNGHSALQKVHINLHREPHPQGRDEPLVRFEGGGTGSGNFSSVEVSLNPIAHASYLTGNVCSRATTSEI